MVYDPAWDMPRVNWQQQGSFETGVIPPSSEPDGGTFVCLPPINQDWLPYVLGCLDQMRNPSTWLVPDDDAMYLTLGRVTRLKQMFGERVPCLMYQMRFTASCVLQFSTDGGITWVDVAGWDANYPLCNPPQPETRLTADGVLQTSIDGGLTWTDVMGWTDHSCVIVDNCPVLIGLPPNPGDKTPDQLACAIAAYLAEQVIIAAIGKAVTAISTDLTLLQFGLDVVNIIPEFVIVGLAADALSAIYVAVQEGTLSDFEAALTDATLLHDMTCAIYGCILADGWVKPDNFTCILTSVGAITYAHADVISAIVAYLTAIGATGLAQLSQVAGLHAGEDCSGCGYGWCLHFHFPDGAGTPFWQIQGAYGVYTAGVGYQKVDIGGVGCLSIQAALGGAVLTSVRMVGVIDATDRGVDDHSIQTDGTRPGFYPITAGPVDVTVPVGYAVTTLYINAFSHPDLVGSVITDVWLRGPGSTPPGGLTSNC